MNLRRHSFLVLTVLNIKGLQITNVHITRIALMMPIPGIISVLSYVVETCKH